jgi:soluble lytic murein transglycosylase
LQRDALALLSASRLAYAAGFLPAGIRYARLAADAAAARPAEDQWGVHPWMYPPAFESLYAAFPESAAADGIERALVRAVTWQESKFDPAARSRSNALGLMQLKLATASDVARWLREAPPTEAKLRDPQTNLRYGVAYLRRLLERCDGKVSAALAAYNAGPGRIGSSWRLLEERGGEALVCELVGYPETRDYVKRIIGARQAYRELRPVASR